MKPTFKLRPICENGHVRPIRGDKVLPCRICNFDKYDRRRRLLDAIQLAIGCQKCGYQEHPAALQFDHIDPSIKEFDISQRLHQSSIKTLLNELEKCQVLCANCHSVKSAEEARQRIATRRELPPRLSFASFEESE